MAGRTRTSNSSIPQAAVTHSITRYALGGCLVDPVYYSTLASNTTPLPFLNNKAMTDVVTPNYKKLQASGLIVNNPMTKTVTVETEIPMTLEYEWRILKLGCTPAREYLAEIYIGDGQKNMQSAIPSGNRYLDVPVITSSKLESLKELAVTKAWSRVSTAEVSGLVTLAELNKTVAGLAKTLGRVFRIYKAIRKMQIKNLKKELSFKELQDVYLEARYGLRPLYYDIKGFAAVLNTEQHLGRQTFRGKELHSETVQSSVPKLLVSSSAAAGFGIYRNYERLSRIDISARAGVLTDITALSAIELMGLGQVAEAAWDLVPFSFIIDWFVNVGNTIASWTPDPGIKSLASWVTVQTVKTQMSNMGIVDTITPCTVLNTRVEVPYVHVSGSSIKTVTTYERIKSPARTIIPNFSVKLDALKLLDLALILKNLSKSGEIIRKYRV